jgi:nucleotide-binding universal stress UspA family protein
MDLHDARDNLTIFGFKLKNSIFSVTSCSNFRILKKNSHPKIITAMKKKLITIAVLPFVKAQVLKTLFEKEGIECILEDVNLLEGTSSLAVRVQILEEDLERAFPVLEEFLGKPGEKLTGPDEPERQILIPVDFSSYSLKASMVAFDISRQLNAKMVLFHAYPNPIVYSVPFSDVYAFDSGLTMHLEAAEKNAQTSMEVFLKKLIAHYGKETWNKVETEYIIKAGDARDDILSYAHKNRVMLIIMGSQGKAGSEYDIIGSVTAEIITSARLPVLVIPPDTPDDIAQKFAKILYATNFDEKDFVAIEKLMRIIKPYNAEVCCLHVSRNEEPVWDLARLEGMKEILRHKYDSKTFECHLIVGDDILDEIDKYITANNIDVLALTTHKRSILTRIFNPSIARRMLFHTNIPLLVFHA